MTLSLLEWLVAGLVVATTGYGLLRYLRHSRDQLETLRQTRSLLSHKLEIEGQRAGQAAAQLSALGKAVLEVLVVVDNNLRVSFATPGAVELFGREPDGKLSLIEFTRSSELDQLVADARTSAPAFADLDRQIPLAGRPYRARAVAFSDGVALALSDVSELQRLGRARRDFIANISHELRTPLTSIRLLLETLASGAIQDPDEAAGLHQKIDLEVQTLQQIAQELLDLAQIESGQALLRMVPAPVAQLIAETVERLEPQATHKRQSVRVDVAPGLTALADAQQVSRALGNLVHNAIKFTPPDGEIRVRASLASGDDIQIEVADNGPGISPDDLPRVFERFFRGDRSRAGGGTGLGLAVSRDIVEAHGGKIWVESEGRPGRGTTFRFTLPSAGGS